MAILQAYATGETTAEAYMYNLSPWANIRYAYFTIWIGNSSIDTKSYTIPAQNSDPFYIEFSGLSPGTTYRITYSIYDYTSGQSWSDSTGETFTTWGKEEPEPEPERGCVVLNGNPTLYDSSYNPDTQQLTVEIRNRFKNNGETYDAIYFYYTFYDENGNIPSGGDDRIPVYLSAGSSTTEYISCIFNNVPDTGSFSFQYIYYSESYVCDTQINDGKWFYPTWTPSPKFWWKSATDRPDEKKEIKQYITASKWNSLCNEIGLTTIANKSPDDVIVGTEVRAIILKLGGSATNYPASDFEEKKPCLAKWFRAIEDLYNG